MVDAIIWQMVFGKEWNQSISVTLSNTNLTFGQHDLCEGVVTGVAEDMIVDQCMGFASSFILSNTYSWQFSLSGGYHLPTMMSALFMDLVVTFVFIVRHTTHVYIVSHHFHFWQYRIALLQGWLQCQLFSPWHPCFPLIINNICAAHQLLVYSFADCGYSCIATILSMKQHLNMPYISFDYKC